MGLQSERAVWGCGEWSCRVNANEGAAASEVAEWSRNCSKWGCILDVRERVAVIGTEK